MRWIWSALKWLLSHRYVMDKQVNHLWMNMCCMGYLCIQRVHKHISILQHLGPTSREVTPLCWWCQPDQRAAACWGHPHPRRAGPLGPPQGVMSGPDLSGTWGDRTQETDAPINSSLPSKPTGRHSSALGHVSNFTQKTFCRCFLFMRCGHYCPSVTIAIPSHTIWNEKNLEYSF